MYSLALFGLLATAASGHMIMNTPEPYGLATLNNSPLDPSGSDFPCKQRSGVYAVSKMNIMAAGSSQILSFTGSASHGGGSCQLSLSKDKEPTKNSKFKVIKSYIGGCPGAGPGNSGGENHSFQIPADFPNGEYALAWTWFNKIGNREMYMNCAPVTITGGGNDDSIFEALPDMFVANLGITTCKSAETIDVVFPDPGQFAETAPSAVKGNPTGDCGTAAGGPPPAPVPAPVAPAPVAPPAPSAPAPPAVTSQAPGEFAQRPTVTMTAFVTVTGAPPAATSPAASAPAAPSSGGKLTCTGTGLICNGLFQFGLCDHGKVIWQNVALGTTCENNAIVKKRSLAFRG
ncbi:hypothetical protein H2201_002422 [Coniosporium apollinis]|uniref:Lytic polysaccharide monooxygenase n=1 Tax=Coniosporium apollinis TaxID=61459 RepID=A0ABQ9P3X5_9PEZI|nr:hypothetical protein H2201_002422 [Coniosporium apollinis]